MPLGMTEDLAALVEQAAIAWRRLQAPPEGAPGEPVTGEGAPGPGEGAPGEPASVEMAVPAPRARTRRRGLLTPSPAIVRPVVCRRQGCLQPAVLETLRLCEGHLAEYKLEHGPLLSEIGAKRAKAKVPARPG